MKWLIYAVFSGCLATLVRGGALCPGSDNREECTTDLNNTDVDIQSVESDVGVENAEAECLAGSEWESNCHRCNCTELGVAECNLQADCVTESVKPFRCKPGTKFPRGCNTCTCLDNGEYLCTLKMCNVQVTIKNDSKECSPGTTWDSQCNSCSCSTEGIAECTMKTCPGQESDEVMRCAPSSWWKNSCNTCWCSKKGIPLCTKMGCIANVNFNPDQPMTQNEHQEDLPEVAKFDVSPTNPDTRIHFFKDERYPALWKYLSGPLKRIDTFIASGTADASFHPNWKDDGSKFTYREHDDVHEDIYGDNVIKELADEKDDAVTAPHVVFKRSVCAPNDEFEVDCNSCKCSSDGQKYSCTQSECMDKDADKEVEVFMESEGVDHIESQAVCRPGGTFNIGCNTCNCNLDGTHYSCTNKPCPLPDDVEIFHELRIMKPIIPLMTGRDLKPR